METNDGGVTPQAGWTLEASDGGVTAGRLDLGDLQKPCESWVTHQDPGPSHTPETNLGYIELDQPLMVW